MSTAAELAIMTSWQKHHESNPIWPSEREAQIKKQARKSAMEEIKARRVAAAAATAATPLVDITNTDAAQSSSSDNDTASASSSRSSTSPRSPLSSPPSSLSSSPVSHGVPVTQRNGIAMPGNTGTASNKCASKSNELLTSPTSRSNSASSIAAKSSTRVVSKVTMVKCRNSGVFAKLEQLSKITKSNLQENRDATVSPNAARPTLNSVLPAPAVAVALVQAAATSSAKLVADDVLLTKPSPTAKSLDYLFDGDEDLVCTSKDTRAAVEVDNTSSSSENRTENTKITKKRKLRFGDEDSEGESDFEDVHYAKKFRASSQDSTLASSATSVTIAPGMKCKRQEDNFWQQIRVTKTKTANTTFIQHPSALFNGKAGCYQNTVLHILSSIPAFATLAMEEPVRGAKGGIAPAFSKMMREMLCNKSDKPIDTKAFQKASGEVFGSEYNGRSQQDADEFLLNLVQQLQKELPDTKLAMQFKAAFVRKANCIKCGVVKEIIDSDLSLVLPMNAARQVSMSDILKEQIDDTSDFEYRSCDSCNSTGNFMTNTMAASKLMRSSPSFLKINIPRHDPKGSQAKNRTKIHLPRECSFLSESGETLRYELVAATGHDGRTPGNGHYMVLRKIENKWFQCDSAEYEGVKRMMEPGFDHKNTHFNMCLFKKS